ncbi:MAG: M48 family metallopeptidase [Gammaproteobacteria bacterium]|nr:M48 family metallopeptidase [Gammaproteobacteria bacterium]MDH5652183.1 M48 family metallopeptidase [Gammaproteobacteria bacterium]
MQAVTIIFLVALSLAFLLQFWLDQRQIQHVRSHRPEVPADFADRISLEEHQKAADYTIDRTRFGLVDQIAGVVILLLWTLAGGLELLDQAWRTMQLGEIQTGVAVMLSFMLISSLIDLPFAAYRTFVIEQRYGFNKMTMGLFISDLFKQSLLTMLIGIPLLWLVLWLMGAMGELWWIYVWAVWIGFVLLMMWAYPAFIAPFFNKFSPLENQDLRERIEQLLNRCGFTSNGIFIMDGSRRSSHGNAYFTGLGRNKRIVFFDTLIESLEPEETEAVLAHELGHFKRKHIQKRIISMALISLTGLAILGWLMQLESFFTGLGVSHSSQYIGLLLFMMVSPLFSIYLQPLFAYFSRKHEFEADAYAAQQSDANKLIQALVKLYRENASTLTPDPLYSAFHDSHPPAPVRIAHLNAQHS